jgi:hypothetical protein
MQLKRLNFRGNSEKASMHRITQAQRARSLAAEDSSQLLAPSTAMRIVALERQSLREKIVHLRVLREAAEAEKAFTVTKGLAPQK